MDYSLKGIALIGLLLFRVTPLPAEPFEEGPLHVSFKSAQLQGESYVFQITQAPDGQIIAAGEQVIFYQDNRWGVVPQLRRPVIHNLLVDRHTLWVSSLNEIGRLELPLRSTSHYEALPIPALASAGEFWQVEKLGDELVAVTNEEVWFINPQSLSARHVKLPNKTRLGLIRWQNTLLVTQPGSPIWLLEDGQLKPFENPLPDKTDMLWLWSNESLVLTDRAIYKKESGGYRRVLEIGSLNKQGVITSTTPWGRYLAVSTWTKGLVLFDLESAQTRFVTPASVLPSLVLAKVFTDRNGRLWVGSSQGITVLESPKYGHEIAPKNHAIEAGRVDGLFISYEDRTEYFHVDGREEILPRTYEFLQTRQGLFLGFWGNIRWGQTDIETPGNRVGATIELPDGDLLVSVVTKLYLLRAGAEKAEVVASPPTEITGFTRIENTLWAITVDGDLYRTTAAPPFTFNHTSKLPGAVWPKLYHLAQTLIAASADGVRFGEQFHPVERTVGLRNAHLATTADGTLWLLGEQDGEQRLGRLRQTGNSVEWQTVEAKSLPLLSDILSLSASGSMLTICAATTILELNTDELKPTYRLDAPRLRFTFASPGSGESVTLPAPPRELRAEANSLAFTGTLPYDEFGERPAFEHRLLPTETTWQPAKAGEKISYASLSARDYSLEVRATHLGHTGPVLAEAFTVLPPWYASSSAIAGYIAAAALLAYLVYRLRTHQIRLRTVELERIVESRTRELAAASAAKTEFLASMSHEIRNPMNGVIGLVNILRDGEVAPKQVRTLKLLQGCADQLRSTVDDILDFSKIEAGHITVESSFFDLLDTLEAAAATVDPSGRAIRFLEKPPANLTLQGDAPKLRQIFANYLSNALKYGVPPEARVNSILTPTARGVQLTLSVISSGPTIEKDTLDQFFESFTRGTVAVERNIHGTGLGLAICKRYARAMGGEVGAVSANGETTFYLTVPFGKVSEAALPHTDTAPRSALPARALAIEDEDYNRIVLGSILAKMNYAVDWATTGAEAIALARENGYDIILTDYRLPDTNGVELTKQILRLCPDPKPAVFAVTAYSTRERREECLAAGMAGFISKPITIEKLHATLAGWGDRQLTKISLESTPMVESPEASRLSPEIVAAWAELGRAAQTDRKKAAELAHSLNNLCRAFGHIDLAEQLELLEGALERDEPIDKLAQVIAGMIAPDPASTVSAFDRAS